MILHIFNECNFEKIIKGKQMDDSFIEYVEINDNK